MYRIRAFSIVSPPLRDRSEDISELAMYYVAKKCNASEILTKGFSPDFFEAINTYDWPGNVRELSNTLDSALVSAGEQPVLFPQHLPVKIRTKIVRTNVSNSQGKATPPIPSTLVSDKKEPESYKDFRDQLLAAGEKQYFYDICQSAKGYVKEACRRSGLSKSRLYHLLQKHGISLSDYK